MMHSLKSVLGQSSSTVERLTSLISDGEKFYTSLNGQIIKYIANHSLAHFFSRITT